MHHGAAGRINVLDSVQLSFGAVPSPVRHQREQDGSDVISELMPAVAISSRHDRSDGFVGAQLAQLIQERGEVADHSRFCTAVDDVFTVDWLARKSAERYVAPAQRPAECCCRKRRRDGDWQLALAKLPQQRHPSGELAARLLVAGEAVSNVIAQHHVVELAADQRRHAAVAITASADDFEVVVQREGPGHVATVANWAGERRVWD